MLVIQKQQEIDLLDPLTYSILKQQRSQYQIDKYYIYQNQIYVTTIKPKILFIYNQEQHETKSILDYTVTSLSGYNDFVLIGDEQGQLMCYYKNKLINKQSVHTSKINCIIPLTLQGLIITCSDDGYVKILSMSSFDIISTLYVSTAGVNKLYIREKLNKLIIFTVNNNQQISQLEVKYTTYQIQILQNISFDDPFQFEIDSQQLYLITNNKLYISNSENLTDLKQDKHIQFQHTNKLTSISINKSNGNIYLSSENQLIALKQYQRKDIITFQDIQKIQLLEVPVDLKDTKIIQPLQKILADISTIQTDNKILLNYENEIKIQNDTQDLIEKCIEEDKRIQNQEQSLQVKQYVKLLLQ